MNLKEIKKELASVYDIEPNKAFKMKSLKKCNTYLYNGQGLYGVAIEFDFNNNIIECFNKVEISTKLLNYDNINTKVLILTCKEKKYKDAFLSLAFDFINPINRINIQKNPYSWINDWKEMLGDSKKNVKVYDLIAELYVLKLLYINDKTATFQGSNYGTHDIECSNLSVEVKSSTKKTKTEVSINSSYQLQGEKKVKLYFCRVEKTPYLNTINSLVKELIELGYNESELEEHLTDLGYKKGMQYREVSYAILEVRSYIINNRDFPIIPLDQLNKMAKSKNIIGYELKLNLDGIEYTKIA